jgi:hypothetical protein
MARQTLEKLINGDREIVEAYHRVGEKWKEILKDFDWDAEDAVKKMAELVSLWQIPMEHVAGERWLGQEIMVIVGIGQFYSTQIGFDAQIKEAKIVYNGFLTSMCSIEVKFHAETIGKLYNVSDYDDETLNF